MSQASPLVGDLAKHLRSRILAGEFVPDAKITESGLAAEYGVARPTARSAVDLLVADGILVRTPFAALRVPSFTAEELPEILAILEFSEKAALQRIADTDPDVRELRKAASGSIHHFLDMVVRCSGSPRLESIHRRATFEFVLLSVQLGHRAVDDARAYPEMRALADALAAARYAEAAGALKTLQARRPATQPIAAAEAR